VAAWPYLFHFQFQAVPIGSFVGGIVVAGAIVVVLTVGATVAGESVGDGVSTAAVGTDVSDSVGDVVCEFGVVVGGIVATGANVDVRTVGATVTGEDVCDGVSTTAVGSAVVVSVAVVVVSGSAVGFTVDSATGVVDGTDSFISAFGTTQISSKSSQQLLYLAQSALH